ncbi:MAG: hypothetical protein HW421_2977 [Ignavibacteria bacterium]|nr:hypothetical protein [Ignavibacteria bacterium]
MKTNAEMYFDEKTKNPEFRAYYTLAREKTKLEFLIEKLIEDINEDHDKKVILKQARKIEKEISKICLA